jgi:hypothetical protein
MDTAARRSPASPPVFLVSDPPNEASQELLSPLTVTETSRLTAALVGKLLAVERSEPRTADAEHSGRQLVELANSSRAASRSDARTRISRGPAAVNSSRDESIASVSR